MFETYLCGVKVNSKEFMACFKMNGGPWGMCMILILKTAKLKFS